MVIIWSLIIPSRYNGMAIFPFIFLRNKLLASDKKLINHENIHLKQQIELLWIFFFIWYGVEFLIYLIKFKSVSLAYNSISFEKEAYTNEMNLNYLKNRKVYTFLKYIK